MARKNHVTAVDKQQAEMLVDVVEALVRPGGRADKELRAVAVNTVGIWLADYREEVLTCAMVRAERIFGLSRKDEK